MTETTNTHTNTNTNTTGGNAYIVTRENMRVVGAISATARSHRTVCGDTLASREWYKSFGCSVENGLMPFEHLTESEERALAQAQGCVTFPYVEGERFLINVETTGLRTLTITLPFRTDVRYGGERIDLLASEVEILNDGGEVIARMWRSNPSWANDPNSTYHFEKFSNCEASMVDVLLIAVTEVLGDDCFTLK